jgi:DNA-binding transcriptional MerR regulator
VKDMIVLKTRNNSVRERLFTEKDLELGKAVTICRSAEQKHEQVQEMNAESRDEAAGTGNVCKWRKSRTGSKVCSK